MTSTPCPKCQGTGYLPQFARVDGGRCWACHEVDTSYTRNVKPLSVEEAAANWAAICEARKAARRARKEGR